MGLVIYIYIYIYVCVWKCDEEKSTNMNTMEVTWSKDNHEGPKKGVSFPYTGKILWLCNNIYIYIYIYIYIWK